MSQAQSAEFSPMCPICGEPVRLEEAMTDEDGRAIHEDCYVVNLKSTISILKSRAIRKSA
jgi:hypothetical protein